MKNLMLILTLAVIMTSAFACAGEAEETTDAEEVIIPECFLDDDGDAICDTCGNTAEECAADLEAGTCEHCTECGDKVEKVEESK